jgi:hypothetical protein
MRRIVQIGYGNFGKILLEKLFLNADILAVCATTSKLELNRRGIRSSTNWQNEIKDADLVVIATPTDTHVEIAKACLRAGNDIFVEKPLARTPEDVRMIIDLATSYGQQVYVDDVFRYKTGFSHFREAYCNTALEFKWQKYGSFNDDIFSALIYHDMYLMIELVGLGKLSGIKVLKTACPLKPGRIDRLELEFMYNGISFRALYDRAFEKKPVKQMASGSIVWENDTLFYQGSKNLIHKEKTPDALERMLCDVLVGKADFKRNNELAEEASRLISYIRDALPKS